MTRLCIPTETTGGLDAPIGEHFGRVPNFTIYNTESESVEILENTSEHMGGSGYPAELLGESGIHVLLCQGLGRRAIQMLSSKGIDVFTGVSGTARDAIDSWKSGGISPVGEEDACTRHSFHDHG